MDTEKAIKTLEALEQSTRLNHWPKAQEAVKEGREALEQRLKAEQEYPL